MDILAMIQAVPGVGPYLPYILAAFGLCAIAAAQLPPPQQTGSVYGALYWLVNLLGQNYNHARNATASATKPSASSSPTVLALLVSLALACGLTACSGTSTNAAGDVAALEASLTAAETVATAYIRLSPCTGTNGPLCSDPGVITQIKSADNQAYTLVKAAEQATDDPSALSAAQAAITALGLIVNALPNQGS